MATAGKRTGIAIGIIAMTALASVGFAGIATAQVQLPETFGTSEPRQGDVVLYNFTYGGVAEGGAIVGSSSGSSSTDFFTGETESYRHREASFSGTGWGGLVIWAWSDPAPVRGADGQTWMAAGLDQVPIHFALAPDRWAFDPLPLAVERVSMVGADVIAVERGMQQPMFNFQFGGLLTPASPGNVEEDEHHVDFQTGSLAGCLMRHALQGADVDTRQPLRLFSGCQDLGIPLPDVAFEAIAVDHLDSGDAVRYEAGDIQVWFAADNPYPVRLQVPVDDTFVVISLDEFIAGDGPVMPPGYLLDGTKAPPAKFAPSFAWGMDDRGAGHPFPLSEAVRLALLDPVYTDFRDWTTAHPDWFAMQALYTETNVRGDIDREWEVVAIDGDDIFPLDVTQQVRPAGGDALRAVMGDPPAVTTVEFNDGPTGGPSFIAGITGPLPSRMPDRLPTLASMVPYWEAFADEVPFNAYGLRLVCRTDCDDVGYEAIVGHSLQAQARSGDDPTDPSSYFVDSYRNDRSDLFTFIDGAPGEHMVGRSTQLMSKGGPPAQTIGGSRVQSADLQAFWAAPDTGATVGLGFVAIIVGALYWSWPVLKGGLLAPLFSRIQTDSLLDNPTRRRIHDTIQAHPGIHFQELGRNLGGANGALHHHVRKLMLAGLLTTHETGGYTCYFVKGQVDRRAMAAAPALKAPSARSIMDLIIAEPGVTSGVVAARTGLASSTLSYHVRRLQDAGLIEVLRSGRNASLVPTGLAPMARAA